MSPYPKTPRDWPEVTLGDVATEYTVRVDNPAESEFERFVGSNHIGRFDLAVSNWGSTSDITSAMKVFRPGDYLLVRRSLYASDFRERAARADFAGVCSGDILTIREKKSVVAPGYLSVVLNAPALWAYIVAHATGSITRRIKWRRLQEYKFVLPPIEEQRRVVQCLAAARSASEKLERLVSDAKTLLNAAINDQMRDYPVRTIGQLVNDGVLSAPQDGNHGEKHPKESDYTAEGVPFIMAADLREGMVDFAGCKKLREDHARSLRIGFAKSGDILLSHKGTVGSVARLQDIPGPFAMLTPQVTYYRSLEPQQLSSDWLYFAFQSTHFRSLLLQRGRQSTRAYIGITAQQELSIPYCDFGRQQQHINILLQIEGGMKEAANRLGAIRALQSVLASEWAP